VCWGTTLLWQADVVQEQCDSYPWLVFVPGSFMVLVAHTSALRLPVTSRAGTCSELKPYRLHFAVRLAAVPAIVSLSLVLIAVTVDPIKRTRVARDPLRAKLDYYYCQSTGVTDALTYALVSGHVWVSLVCLLCAGGAERAGGIRDSSIVLYGSVLFALISQYLGLPAEQEYLFRSIAVNVGVTLFVTRILFQFRGIGLLREIQRRIWLEACAGMVALRAHLSPCADTDGGGGGVVPSVDRDLRRIRSNYHINSSDEGKGRADESPVEDVNNPLFLVRDIEQSMEVK